MPADLSAHLARIKRQGFESRPSYKVRGIINISYPIFDERGSAIGALTVPYIQHMVVIANTSQVSAQLKKAAREITAAIGGRIPQTAGARTSCELINSRDKKSAGRASKFAPPAAGAHEKRTSRSAYFRDSWKKRASGVLFWKSLWPSDVAAIVVVVGRGGIPNVG